MPSLFTDLQSRHFGQKSTTSTKFNAQRRDYSEFAPRQAGPTNPGSNQKPKPAPPGKPGRISELHICGPGNPGSGQKPPSRPPPQPKRKGELFSVIHYRLLCFSHDRQTQGADMWLLWFTTLALQAFAACCSRSMKRSRLLSEDNGS